MQREGSGGGRRLVTAMPGDVVRDRAMLPAPLLVRSQVVVHGSLRHAHAAPPPTHIHTHGQCHGRGYGE